MLQRGPAWLMRCAGILRGMSLLRRLLTAISLLLGWRLVDRAAVRHEASRSPRPKWRSDRLLRFDRERDAGLTGAAATRAVPAARDASRWVLATFEAANQRLAIDDGANSTAAVIRAGATAMAVFATAVLVAAVAAPFSSWAWPAAAAGAMCAVVAVALLAVTRQPPRK